MVKVTDKNYYMNETLTYNLDILKKAVKKGWDGIVMIDGIEGSAKTTLAAACCYYLDPNYGINNVVFTQKQFFELVDKAPKGTAIHWDEFVFGGLSTEALNKVQNALIKKMTTIRQKGLFIFLLMPWFFMMRPYFAIGRSRCLIHTYTPDGIARGYFHFYSFQKKSKLYHQGKKEYYYGVNADFKGRFTNTFGKFWDEDEYNKKKNKAITELTMESGQKRELVWKKHLFSFIKNLKDKEGYTYTKLGKIAGLPPTTISTWYSYYDLLFNKS